MRLSFGHLTCILLGLFVTCLLMTGPTDARSSSVSHRSASRSSSLRSTFRSRSRSRSARSKVKKGTKTVKKGVKKVKKGVKKVKKALKKLPKAAVKLPQFVLPGRRLKKKERYVVWKAAGIWYGTMRLRNTTPFLNYRCRLRFTVCREQATSNNVSTDSGYCTFVDTKKTCLTQGSRLCSKREMRWLKLASCYEEDSTAVDWSNSTWAANEPLKLSVDSLQEPCQQQFEHCRQMAAQDDTQHSYCALVHDRKDCLLSEGNCTKDDYAMLSDAACQRTAVNWEDSTTLDSPPQALRLAAAATPLNCQLEFEICRLNAVNQGTATDYCGLVQDGKACITDDACSMDDWQSFLDGACSHNSALKMDISVLLLIVTALLKKSTE